MHEIPTLELGSFRVHWLRGGRFRLDGGAMFGPVPKVLWRRRYPCDEHNTIPMQASPLLVVTPEARLLIDTGTGDKLDEKQKRIFRREEAPAPVEDLARLGLTPEDIDFVVMTHMDWDHASGGTVVRDGRLVPAYPKARYVVQRVEWEACTNPTSRTRHGYWPENWQPLQEHDVVELVDGEAEIVPGVRVHLTGGHTHGHQLVFLDGAVGSGAESTAPGAAGGSKSTAETVMLHLGDIMPTHAHLNPLWVMGYDNFPLTSIEQKELWLPRAQAGKWLLSFYHDPFLLAGTLDEEGNIRDNLAGALEWPPDVTEVPQT